MAGAFCIDRRGRWFFSTVGNDRDNVRKLNNLMYGTTSEITSWFARVFDDRLRRLGHRPVVLHGLAGQKPGTAKYTAAFGEALLPNVKRAIEQTMIPHLWACGCQAIVYMGWAIDPKGWNSIDTPTTFSEKTETGKTVVREHSPTDLTSKGFDEWLLVQYRKAFADPRMIAGVIVDECAVEGGSAEKLADRLQVSLGVTAGGEALPIVPVGSDPRGLGGVAYAIDDQRIELRPWMCMYEWLRQIDFAAGFRVNPLRTQVNVVLRRADAAEPKGPAPQNAPWSLVAIAKGLLARGFIVDLSTDVDLEVAEVIFGLK